MRDRDKTIGNLIDKQTVCFMSAVDRDGFPHTFAMNSPRIREGIKTFYFSTNNSSKHISLYRENDKASLYFADRRFYRGITLKGQVEVLREAQYQEMIWQDGDTMFYPEGVHDPDYCVMRFTALEGRYYGNLNMESFEI